jgi:hypothetical protein
MLSAIASATALPVPTSVNGRRLRDPGRQRSTTSVPAAARADRRSRERRKPTREHVPSGSRVAAGDES